MNYKTIYGNQVNNDTVKNFAAVWMRHFLYGNYKEIDQ